MTLYNPALGDANEFLGANMKLVYYVMYRFEHHVRGSRSYDQNDLISIGMYALCTAYQTFDPAKGAKFSTYAVNAINFAYLRFLRDHVRKDACTISFEDISAQDKQGHVLTIEDTLAGPALDDMELGVRDYLSTLTDRERKMVEMKESGTQQRVIAAKFGLSQTQVSRILHRIWRRYQAAEWQHVS